MLSGPASPVSDPDGADLAYEALASTPVAEQPFPHVVVPGFVPAATLPEVIAGLPPLDRGGSFPMEGLPLGPAARSLLAALQGERFREAIAAKFAIDLRHAPTMVTLRGSSRERDGRIHRDSVAKRVTVLLYLNPGHAAWERQEGCLRLLRRSDDIEDYAVEVPPTNGTLLVFPNGPTTWHGHKQFLGRRYVVQLNYMSDDQQARAELRRHRLSALLKRWLPTGVGSSSAIP